MLSVLDIISIETMSGAIAKRVIASLNDNGYTVRLNAEVNEVDWKLHVPPELSPLTPQEYSDRYLCDFTAGVLTREFEGVESTGIEVGV